MPNAADDISFLDQLALPALDSLKPRLALCHRAQDSPPYPIRSGLSGSPGLWKGPVLPEFDSPKNHCPLHSPFRSETSPRTQRVEFY